MDTIDLLSEVASRPRQALDQLRPQLSSQVADAHPGGHDNSVTWLLWHTGREVDVQLAAMTGEPELWARHRDATGLGEAGDGLGYGHDAEEARRVANANLEAVVAYVEASLQALERYVASLSAEALDDVVDTSWDPHVTRGVRLVSIVDDAAQHLAQAAYVVGMPQLAE